MRSLQRAPRAPPTSLLLPLLLLLLALPPLLPAAAEAADWDHQAHAVPGADQFAYENPPGSGAAELVLDGTRSHSHYFDEGPPVVSGRIVSYTWRDLATDDVLGRNPVLTKRFAVGTTTVELSVADQTGDKASATVDVTVVPADRVLPGAMVYFYDVPTTEQYASSSPRPFFAQWHKDVAVWDHRDLPKDLRSQDTTRAIRVVTQFLPERTGRYQFKLRYMGGPVRVFVNEELVGKSDAEKEGKESALEFSHNATEGEYVFLEILLTRKYFPTRIVLSDNAKATDSLPATEHGVTTADTLFFEPQYVPPIAMYGSRGKASTDGGDPYSLRVSGLDGAGGFSVWFACVDKREDTARKLEITQIDAIKHTVHGVIPKFPEPCKAEVYVETALKGDSTSIPFEFVGQEGRSHGGQVIKFEKAAIQGKNGKPLKLIAATTIAFGPDGRYYIGTLMGVIHVLSVDSNSLKVQSSCKSPRVVKKASILGMAFNPLDKYTDDSATLYMSTSVLYWRNKNTGNGWNNGQIIAWKSVPDAKRCMVFDRTVISGLPVSDRDHGVNAITFDTTGKLYISVGSNTNGGVRGPLFGNIPESVLSAAILVADIGKAGFNGNIKYTSKSISKAKKKSGDVDIFASGVRNCFGLTYHSQFGLYATDNGMNQNFGKTSTGCNSAIATKKTQQDKLMRIVKGNYYGFPVRQRGECKFIPGKGALIEMEPATTGVAEYTTNNFNGRLRGSLFLSKFAVRQSGLTTRVTLSGDGNKVQTGPTKVGDMSGLSVVIGPRGEVVMPQVQQGLVRVLRPVEKFEDGPVVVSVRPNAGRRGGGNVVRVYGSGFGAAPSVKIGGKACKNVKSEEGGKVVTCEVAAGEKRGEVAVVVSSGGEESVSYGGEYFYA